MSINIPWLEVLKACYPNGQISEETEVLVVSPQYAADIAVIMVRVLFIYSDYDALCTFLYEYLLFDQPLAKGRKKCFFLCLTKGW